MGKDGSGLAAIGLPGQEVAGYIGAPWPTLQEAEARVLRMQTKLHQWAVSDLGAGLMICSTLSMTWPGRAGMTHSRPTPTANELVIPPLVSRE